MTKYPNINTIGHLSNLTLKALVGQQKGLYWSALQKSIAASPINTNGLELTSGELFRMQKDTRTPLARVRKPICTTWQLCDGRPRGRYGNVNPR